jgi:molybdate transport system ATP-binding protein
MSRDGTIAGGADSSVHSRSTRHSDAAQGFTALFGPSGCGKTTLLRCRGTTHLPDSYFSRETKSRDQAISPAVCACVGYVFQEASLFAHMSVRQNLLCGYRRAVANGSQQHQV